MLETERELVILGLIKIAENPNLSRWMENVCLKAARMLNAVVDGRIENKKGHWIESPEFWELTCSECGKTWGTCDNDTQDFCFCPSCGAEMEVSREASNENERESDAQQPVDAILVIRCKDCKYFDKATVNANGFMICGAIGMEITPTDFCSYAERKE